MPYLRSLIAALGLVLAAQVAIAQPSNGGDWPKAGITMERVEKLFGPPQSMRPPIGEPPITRWIYPDFTVYFEYDRVIHAVSNEKKPVK